MPSLCRVGARFRSTGWFFITTSSASQTSDLARSTDFLAAFILFTMPVSTRRFITKGLKSSSAISFGRPHWYILSSGPTTITDRPE